MTGTKTLLQRLREQAAMNAETRSMLDLICADGETVRRAQDIDTPELSTIRDTASDMLKKHSDTLKMHYEHDGRMWDVEVRVLDVVANPSPQSQN